MHRKNPLSETHEMYLKTVYSLRADREVARVRDLADGLGVSPGTVSLVLKKLEQRHLVNHERYGSVSLTPTGSRVAECVMRRFETVRDVLVELFGIDAETAAIDACMMEHAVSPATVSHMRAALLRARAKRAALPRGADVDPCAQCEALGVCQAEAKA
ncbi:MAG TPA: metal-dependent transcriptional regulator [Candidatus Polarisedimenticolaceae bacterium]|nr:metal-dependent transcriptional regulator [Candidatus Polarisedimenticolaceae bacterium]